MGTSSKSSSKASKFDEQHKFVTSAIFPSWWLACIRLLLALYTLVVSLVTLIWEARGFDSSSSAGSWVIISFIDSDRCIDHWIHIFLYFFSFRYFSYFTNLSYIGICAYFFASAFHTFAYDYNLYMNEDKNSVYPLQRWPRILRYLHGLLFTTVVTFRKFFLKIKIDSQNNNFFIAFVVTFAYWGLLSSASTFATPFSSMSYYFWYIIMILICKTAWSNISKHILNSVMAIFEITLTNVGRLLWIDMLTTVVVLESYLGIVYITYATQGIYSAFPSAFVFPS